MGGLFGVPAAVVLQTHIIKLQMMVDSLREDAMNERDSEAEAREAAKVRILFRIPEESKGSRV